MPLEPNIYPCWATPIYRGHDPELKRSNAELEALVRDLSSYRDSDMLSQAGGWRTEPVLLRQDLPAMKKLGDSLYLACMTLCQAMGLKESPLSPLSLLAEAWGNIYKANDFQIPHIHHDSVWSGVYFVRVPQRMKEGEGVLTLYDPRLPSRLHPPETTTMRIVPKAGEIVVFPSWLRHSVSPHRSTTDRVSIAFNVGLDRQRVEA